MPINDPRFAYHAQAILNPTNHNVKSKDGNQPSEPFERALSPSDEQSNTDHEQLQKFQNSGIQPQQDDNLAGISAQNYSSGQTDYQGKHNIY